MQDDNDECSNDEVKQHVTISGCLEKTVDMFPRSSSMGKGCCGICTKTTTAIRGKNAKCDQRMHRHCSPASSFHSKIQRADQHDIASGAF